MFKMINLDFVFDFVFLLVLKVCFLCLLFSFLEPIQSPESNISIIKSQIVQKAGFSPANLSFTLLFTGNTV